MAEGVFVYGTLKTGQSNFHVVKNFFTSAQEARCPGMAVYDLGCYPGMIATNVPTDYVYGEFHKYSDLDAALKRLDMLEGYRVEREWKENLYNRIIVQVELGSGETVFAYAYIYSRDVDRLAEEGELCADGVWLPKPLEEKPAEDPEDGDVHYFIPGPNL